MTDFQTLAEHLLKYTGLCSAGRWN